MAYGKFKKYGARKGKASGRRRSGAKATQKWNKGTLDKFVEAKVERALKKASRGPPRSVPVQLLASLFDRSEEIPAITPLDRWTSYIEGPLAQKKYAILPISEVIPSQRPSSSSADDRFRSYDTVLVKGVSLRLTLNHAEGVRLLVFAFRNGMRRDTLASAGTRPFVDASSVKNPKCDGGVVSELYYDIMSKEELMNMDGVGKHYFRNLGIHDGPFAVRRVAGTTFDSKFDWKSTDSSAFTSRFNKEEGRPVGTVYGKVDGGVSKSHGKAFKALFGTASLMRTVAYDGQNPDLQGWISSRHRQVELFIKLNKRERFTVSNGSRSVNECPLELFVGFDSPGSLHSGSSSKNVASGAIMAMDMEVYYE
ncbi:hypothetical protein LV161_008837 [Aspergillus fumigatus]|nr:hypothetical protein LV161_008837 [Aspergillus fumigatus]